MSTVLHPVGPQPERVYWVRRLALLLVCLLVVAVVWVLLSGGRGAAQTADDPAGGDAAAGDVAEVAAPGEAPADGAAASGPAACTAAELALTLTTTARLYAGTEQPVLAVGITNTGTVSCTIDAGDSAREIVITSGADRIWSSLDCPSAVAERLLLLPAGARDEVQVTWPRVRSATGCPTDLPAPRPGTYTAVTSVLGATSGSAVFELG